MTNKTVKIGTHRGNARLWFEGKWLAAAGFAPGDAFGVTYGDTIFVRARLARDGDRKISGKRKGDNTVPVIDLCCDELTVACKGAEQANVIVGNRRLTITPITS